MSDGTAASGDLDDVLERLRRVVQQRRESGEYPPALELRLAHHRRTHDAGQDQDGIGVRRLLRDLDWASQFGTDRIQHVSGMPLGSQLHRTIGKLVVRQTEGILEQQRTFAEAVRAILVALVEAQPGMGSTLADLSARVDLLLERAASSERLPDDAPAWAAELAARVDRLDRAVAANSGPPAGLPEPFAETDAERTQHAVDVAARFTAGPVVDLGFGHGELLDALKERGIECSGADTDPALVDLARRRHLVVSQADPEGYLMAQEDASLGGVHIGQAMLRLGPAALGRVLGTAARKLRPDGILVLDSPNPSSVSVLAGTLAADPTLVPIHPAAADGLARQAGFATVETTLRGDVVGLPDLPVGTGLDEAQAAAINEAFAKLNSLLYGARNYTLIATR